MHLPEPEEFSDEERSNATHILHRDMPLAGAMGKLHMMGARMKDGTPVLIACAESGEKPKDHDPAAYVGLTPLAILLTLKTAEELLDWDAEEIVESGVTDSNTLAASLLSGESAGEVEGEILNEEDDDEQEFPGFGVMG